MYRLWKILLVFWILLNSAHATYGDTQAQPTHQQPQSNQSHDNTNSDACGTDISPLVVKVVPATKTEYDGPDKERQRQKEAESAFWSVAQVVVGGITFVVLVIQAVVFGTQARRLRETIEQMKITEERQLRAYICWQEGCVAPHASEGYYDVTFSLRNSGQTPAYDVQSWRCSSIVDLPEPNAPFQTADSWGGRGMVGPGANMGAVGELRNKLTPEDRINIKQGKRTIFVWGEVTYRDAFGKPRFTRFRFILGSETSRGWLLRPAQYGNEAN